jgi:transposase
MNGILIMTHNEQERLKVFSQVDEHLLTYAEAAQLLRLSERQVYRLIKRYHSEGNTAVVHGLRGKPSNRRYSQDERENILRIYRAQFADYGPTLFAEVLRDEQKIRVHHETIRRWLLSEGIGTFERKKRPHRRKRERRCAIGELLQFDGSPHDWFEGRGPACCLLHAIDDASGRAFLRFVPSENSADVLRTLLAYVERYGIPQALYTDRGSVFYAEHNLTDVGRAMEMLGVRMIFANSPQAKGRVERGNRTHQDRLVKELRQAGISTMVEANQFLDDRYLDAHNARFACMENLADIHRSAQEYDVKNIFCFQTLRQVRNDYTITLDGQYVQLELSEVALPPPKQYVTVRRWLDGSLHIVWKTDELKFTQLPRKPKRVPALPRKPAPNHPWRMKPIGRAR